MELIRMARNLGKQAFKDGKKCIPALDGKLVVLLGSSSAHPKAAGVDILKAWQRGWTDENLKL